MKTVFALLGFALLVATTPEALAAHRTVAAPPAITITSPHSGATIQGASVTMSVSVAHFSVETPVFKNPPVRKGFVGSIEYVLDSPANFVPTRDVTGSTTHTWTNVAPGRHTLIAMFTTSLNVPWPSGPVAKVSVNVQPVARPNPPGAGGSTTSPGVRRGPTTGGAADLATTTIPHSPLNLGLLAAGLAAILLGIVLLGRRFAFAAFSGPGEYRRDEVAAEVEVVPAVQTPIPDEDPPEREATMDETLDTSEEDRQPEPPVADVPSGRIPLDGEDEQPETQPSVPGPAGEFPPIGSFPSIAADSEMLPETETPEYAAASYPQPEPTLPPSAPASDLTRDRAVEMARQWSGVVEALVHQLDEQEAERRRMLEHIRMLEERLRSTQTLRDKLRDSSAPTVTSDEFQAVRYVADSLLRDPDHIVNLAAVAQHADKLHKLVESYAALRQAIENQ